jgi:hypothetical protein
MERQFQTAGLVTWNPLEKTTIHFLMVPVEVANDFALPGFAQQELESIHKEVGVHVLLGGQKRYSEGRRRKVAKRT